MAPQVPGLFYSTKLQASLAWWKQPLNFASKKVVRYIEHGVKVEFKKGLPFAPKPSAPKFVDPQDVDFAIQDLLKGRRIGAYQDLAPGGEQFLSRSRVHTPPGKGKQRIVHALCSLNEATVKRQTTYEDLRMLKSVVKPQDFMLSLDVESAYFHVPIHPKHRKFFSSHLALPLFVNNKFIELQPGGYFVCSRPDLAPLVPSAQTPSHLRHLYHQVVEFSHAALPLGWTSSPRIWTSVMSVVAAALRRHGMRTLLYVDDLLIACSSFEEASQARRIIEETLLAAGIVRAPLKGCFDTPLQTLPDHLGFSISTVGKGALRVPERRCFALRRQARALLFGASKNRRLVDSDLLRRFAGAAISCLPAVPLARFHLREVFNSQEQYKPRSFLSQGAVDNLLFWRNFSGKSPENLQELWPDQPSTALYTDASGTTGWGSVLEPPHEATRSSAGWWASQEVLEMIALKELKAVRHGLHQNLDAIRGRTVKLYQDNMAVVGALRKMSSRCPALMTEIKELVPWLLEHKIRLEVVYIRSEANLADAPSRQRGLDMWSLHLPTQQELLRLVESTLGSKVCTDPFACRQSAVAPRFATPLHCRHSAAFNGLLLDWSQPVTLWLNPPWHLLPQVLEKLRVSRARGILVYPYWPLQPWFQEVQRLSALHFSLPPPRHCVRSHHPGLVEPFVNREVRLRAVVFDCA